jgi:hypothetical protein
MNAEGTREEGGKPFYGPLDLEGHLGTRVKGEERRRDARDRKNKGS